jgi:hypothetical protein
LAILEDRLDGPPLGVVGRNTRIDQVLKARVEHIQVGAIVGPDRAIDALRLDAGTRELISRMSSVLDSSRRPLLVFRARNSEAAEVTYVFLVTTAANLPALAPSVVNPLSFD